MVRFQHDPDISLGQLTRDILEQVVLEVIPAELLVDTVFYINPTGRFVLGGPAADTGLTGRKIIEPLSLRTPIYRSTASYGHFGAYASGKPWESEQLAPALRCGIGEAESV